MGDAPAPLEWAELQAYAGMTGTILSREDWRLVVEMSTSYCASLSDKNPFSMSPVDKAERDG